ncbi:hypothetical protein GbCGDNIH4_8205 [Granulibacter bethesdensis CGDNIH4]|nr:hypothetical protein GbCGDNIH4_8205 [Granulibacter bethesdensis CGDNIH4]
MSLTLDQDGNEDIALAGLVKTDSDMKPPAYCPANCFLNVQTDVISYQISYIMRVSTLITI